MIKPVGMGTPVVNKFAKNILTKSARIEKLQNLIKEFEECAKGAPENKALADHIAYLKSSLENLLKSKE